MNDVLMWPWRGHHDVVLAGSFMDVHGSTSLERPLGI